MSNISRRTIIEIVKAGLCVECGTCVAACPSNAIRIVKFEDMYLPIINYAKCKECGTCYQVCPSNYEEILNQNQVIKKHVQKWVPYTIKYDRYLGSFIKTYLAYSTNTYIRYSASSGGIISTLIYFLLKEKYIDAAILVCDSIIGNDSYYEPIPCVIKTLEEFVNKLPYIFGSRYRPVPLNQVLEKIAKDKSLNSIAFVGLPCHIRGLKKLQEYNSYLRKKKFITIGLFCNNTPSLKALKYLLTVVIGLNRERISKITRIQFRGRGWPGFLTIEFKDTTKLLIPFFKYRDSGFGQFFMHKRCLLCTDQTAELADISVGDAWLADLISKERLGISTVITRTPLGEEILRRAANKNYLVLHEIPHKKAIQQAAVFKKQLFGLWLRTLGIAQSTDTYKYMTPTAKFWYYYIRVGRFFAKYEKLWKLAYMYARIYQLAINILKAIRKSVKSINIYQRIREGGVRSARET